MDKDSPRWIWFLVGRVASYALLGGLTTAFVGAVCIAVTGALTAVCLSSGSSLGGSLEIATLIGAILGGGGGAIVGFLIFGLIRFFSPPQRRYLPQKPHLVAVIYGQILGTVGACPCFFAYEALQNLIIGHSGSFGMGGDIIVIMFGAPAMMMCGAIVGAMWASQRAKKIPNTALTR